MIIVYILIYLVIGFFLAKAAKYYSSETRPSEEYAMFVFIWLPVFVWLLMVKIFDLLKKYI